MDSAKPVEMSKLLRKSKYDEYVISRVKYQYQALSVYKEREQASPVFGFPFSALFR